MTKDATILHHHNSVIVVLDDIYFKNHFLPDGVQMDLYTLVCMYWYMYLVASSHSWFFIPVTAFACHVVCSCHHQLCGQLSVLVIINLVDK